MSRQSSKGNPYHYPAGTPRGGQFAPKGYAQAAASAYGMYFEDREAFENYKDFDGEFYKRRTESRFNGSEPSDGQVEFAKRIEKSLGVVAPENGTAREYEDYINENIHEYNAASEAQARTIRHLEETHGIVLASDDRYGDNAGSFIGHAKKASAVLKSENWEKHDDGCHYCIERQYNEDGSLKLKKDGTPYGSDTGYRMRPVKVNGKTRYVVERGDSHYETGADGKKHRVRSYHPVASDGTGLKPVASDLEEGRKKASANELRRYMGKSSQRSATKRIPEGRRDAVKHFENMASADNWSEVNGGLEYAHSYDQNNSYKYRIEQGTTGLHVYREVTSVETRKAWDSEKGEMVSKTSSHTRQEWVATGCANTDEAIHAARTHEAKSVLGQRTQKKPSDKEMKKWIEQGRIKSKKEYDHILDPMKDFLK